VVFTGVSGSGKSSLAFDTIYTEAQRQLIETFSTYARRRLPKLTRPPVDEIRNISPCIVIDQKRLGASSRSTVGTATEIYTYLRMLYSRAASPFLGWSHLFSFNHPDGMCPGCKGLGKRITVDLHKLLDRTKTIRDGAIQHPDYDIGKWYYRQILWSGVLPADKPLSEFSDREMDRLLWADKLPISYEDHGKTYQRTFDGVARKLEQLHVDKDEDQISGDGHPGDNRHARQELHRAVSQVMARHPIASITTEGGWHMPMMNPPHPALSVRRDCLEPLGLSITEAAKRLGVSRKQLSDLVNGRSGISPVMAIRLDKAFGGGAGTWYRHQAAYDLAQAMVQAEHIEVEPLWSADQDQAALGA